MAKLSFVDLFSGAGGMSAGFTAHPAFRPVFAVDAEKGKPSSGDGALECNATYEANIGIKPLDADLFHYNPRQLLKDAQLKRGQLDVLIACAPCTGFSRAVNRNHTEDDPRNSLVQRMGKFVDALRPKVFLMENARELVRGNFAHHCEKLGSAVEKLGYSFLAEVHFLNKFGLPQIRERAIVLAVRDNGLIRTLEDLWMGFEISSEAITVRRAIAHLPSVAAGEAHPSDPMHVSPAFVSPITLERVKAIPHDGGSWADLVEHPRADVLLIPSMKRSVARGDFGSHPDVYGRLWWDRPCVTIKRECAHVGNGRYSHPEQDRQCTVREIALMNGFPGEYKFVGRSLSNKYRHIGDAVPPLISFQLAHLCRWIITGKKPRIEECVLPGGSLRVTDIQPAKHRSLFDLPGVFA